VRLSSFNDPDWILEPKWDGFRALACVDGHGCQLVSRRENECKSWPYLCEELAHAINCPNAVIDDEIVYLRPDVRSDFCSLMPRRDWPYFIALDLLSLNRRHAQAAARTKAPARQHHARVESRIRLVEGIAEHGIDFFHVACKQDLDGVVAKSKDGTYTSGPRTSWLKVRNPNCSQWENRRELFEARRDNAQCGRRSPRPQLTLG
jgi:bifunctional non-homologous end joining protein LigD